MTTARQFSLGVAALGCGLAFNAHHANAAAKPSSAPSAPSARSSKTPAKSRAVTSKRGLPMINVAPAPGRAVSRGSVVGGSPKVPANPSEPQIQGPTLQPGETAEVRIDQPIDKAIGLIARGIDRYIPMTPKGERGGLEFRGGTGAIGSKPRVGFTLASGPLAGDDLEVECTGKLPSTLHVHVEYTSMKSFGGGVANMTIPTSNGKAKFFVHQLGVDPWGVLTVYLHSETHALYSLTGCTIERDPA